jgi:hypothetical protein
MGNAIVDVKLLRFESQSDVDLKKVMALLGMPKAFLHKLKRHFYLFASDLIRIFVPHSVTSAKTYGSIVSQS